MLTEGEKAGIESFLTLFSPGEIRSLAVTLSKGHLSFEDNKECVDAIIAFTESGTEFLSRKKCTKTLLIQYGFKEKLSVYPQQAKDQMILVILDHWSKLAINKINKKKEVVPLHVPQNRHHEPRPTQYVPVNHIATERPTVVNNYTVNINTTLHHTQTNIQNLCQSPHRQSELDTQFGEEFVRWFYTAFNHHDPVSQGFGPSIFLPGVALRTESISLGNLERNDITECDNVATYLLNLFGKFKLNPNISADGVRTKSDPHGLRLVLACGTVFNGSALCGLFEQSFGLVQSGENWKIQVMMLRMKETRCSSAQTHTLEAIMDLQAIEDDTIRALQIATKR